MDDDDVLRYHVVDLMDAINDGHAMLRGRPDEYYEEEYSSVLDILTHFARVPGFEASYGWLAGLHITRDERDQVRQLALKVSAHWQACMELEAAGVAVRHRNILHRIRLLRRPLDPMA